MVQVVWVLNKAGNTGDGPGLGPLLSNMMHDPEAIIEKPAIVPILERWCADHGYREWSTDLCARFGLHVRIFAKPRREHEGKNNVVATYFHCDASSGLARSTIIGKALLLRLDGPHGKPVDLTKQEVLRAGFFLNDLMDTYDDDYNPREWSDIFTAWQRCYPYDDCITRGDTMNAFGFGGNGGRYMNGLTGEQRTGEDNAEPFPIVESFRIPE
jgi:hypothetical protein